MVRAIAVRRFAAELALAFTIVSSCALPPARAQNMIPTAGPAPTALGGLTIGSLAGGRQFGDGSLPGLPNLANAAGTNNNPSANAAQGVHPVQMNLIQALQSRSRIPESAPVPPTQELEVLDPNVDPNGRPAVIPVTGADGRTRINIPPAVVVHRFYYSGDRSFQGPMLPGGPTVIVANHPTTGERLYLELQLPPGAPRVIYTRHSIEYSYGVQSIILAFGSHGRPKIHYRQGVPATARAQIVAASAVASTARLVRRTGVPDASKKVAAGVVNVVQTSADHAHDIGKAVVTPVIQIVKVIPGVSMLTSSAEDRAARERDMMVQKASALSLQADSAVTQNR
jgi:hypothetical protein